MTFDAYLATRAICLTLDAETIDDQVIRYMREAWEAAHEECAKVCGERSRSIREVVPLLNEQFRGADSFVIDRAKG